MWWSVGYVVVLLCCSVDGSLFHVDSQVLISPATPAKLFGYSLLLRNSTIPQLVVGAPAATSTHAAHGGLGNTGAIYRCSLDLTNNPTSITCPSYEFDPEGNTETSNGRDILVHHYKNEMWLGAALTEVDSNGTLVICAPRWCNYYESPKASHRLVNGMCYLAAKDRVALLLPLADMAKQAFVPRDQGGTMLNYFAYGQVGFSAKVTADHNWLLLGAPGMSQWQGGVAKYRINRSPFGRDMFAKQVISNPYYSDFLDQDAYFGYTIDSGVFEIGGATLGVGGAPRGEGGLGQVLIFELTGGIETSPLRVKTSLTGKQLGSYFGSAILVTDLDLDGRADLLVGAPLYTDSTDDATPYDQGAVYVYINHPKESGFTLELVATLTGSGESGARFGSALASLGDVDDGDDELYPEIAVGAPWESEGHGAVYIYKGARDGVKSKQYIQRISSQLQGFGYSISNGFDIDGNGCNDLIVGAVMSGQAVLYRCTRSVYVTAEIKVPGALDLPENATSFLVEFCLVAAKTKQISGAGQSVAIDVTVSLSVDVGGGRASLPGDTEYTAKVEPGSTSCKEQLVAIHATADLTRPITVAMTAKSASGYPPKGGSLGPGVRLGDGSRLQDSVDVQLTRDCGEDLVCQPSLQLEVSSNSRYVPGSGERLAATIRVTNGGEPAYEACVNITVPTPLLRIPSNCRLYDMVLSCDLQRPFPRRAEANWNLEMDVSSSMTSYNLMINTRVYESCRHSNGIVHTENDFTIQVTPEANITIIGTALPNETLTISKQALSEGQDYDFGHFFAITNYGPSDLPALDVEFTLPKEVSLVKELSGCARSHNSSRTMTCTWSLPAHRQRTLQLPYRFSLHHSGELLKRDSLDIITTVYIQYANITLETWSSLSLEPAAPLWPIFVAIFLGLFLVATISFVLYRAGFFSREHRERLRRRMQEEISKIQAPSSMEDILIDDSDHDLEIDGHSREPSPLDVYGFQ